MIFAPNRKEYKEPETLEECRAWYLFNFHASEPLNADEEKFVKFLFDKPKGESWNPKCLMGEMFESHEYNDMKPRHESLPEKVYENKEKKWNELNK